MIEGFDEPGEDTSISSVPNALALFNPAVVLAPAGDYGKDNPRLANMAERTGVEPEKLSPYHHVRKDLPPTIIFHGRADTAVPFASVEMFASAMQKAGNVCQLNAYDGQGHGFFNFNRGDGSMYRATLAALDKFLVELGYLPAARDKIVVTDRARRIHDSAILVDGHNDLPWKIRTEGSSTFDKLDISQSQPELHTDIARLRAGGVKAQFWSVYVPAGTRQDGKALSTTLEQIAIVKAMMKRYPDTFELALYGRRHRADLRRGQDRFDDRRRRRAFDRKLAGRVAPIVRRGCPLHDAHALRHPRLGRLGHRRGTKRRALALRRGGGARDEPTGHAGRHFARLGPTMQQALRLSQAPVIFSHSSARAIADHPRNVPDDVLRMTAENGGVVMVNFYSGFIVPAAAERGKAAIPFYRELKEKYGSDTDKIRAELRRWAIKNPIDPGSVHVVLDHIDHIVQVAGIDHVGLGSDFDGIETVPVQLEDVSTYPNITQGLLDRGYNEEDIHKILGGNLLRAMRGAEEVARKLQSAGQGREPAVDRVDRRLGPPAASYVTSASRLPCAGPGPRCASNTTTFRGRLNVVGS